MKKITLILIGLFIFGTAFSQKQSQEITAAKNNIEQSIDDLKNSNLSDQERIMLEKEIALANATIEKGPAKPSISGNGTKAALTEGFESTFAPDGWALGGDSDWDQSQETTANSGTYYARYNCYGISAGDEGYLTTPALFPTAGDVTFSYYVNYYYISGSYGNTAELYVDIYDVDGDTWTNGTTNVISGQHGAGWFQESIDLSNYETMDFTDTKIQVRFRAVSDWGSYNIAVDDVAGPEIWTAPDDAGIISINNPQDGDQTGMKTVNVTLKNFGGNDLTSATIAWEVDGVAQTDYNWTSSKAILATGETENVDIGTYDFADETSYNIKVWTESPNGSADGDADNDTSEVDVNMYAPIVPPYTEDFENAGTIPDKWTNSADDDEDWQFLTGAIGHGATQDHTSGSGYYAAVDDSDFSGGAEGNEMILISPPIDLASSGFTYPVVEFWYMNTDNTSAPMTELYVEGWNGSSWDQLMLIDEPYDAWTEFTVKIDDYLAMNDFKMRFRAVTSSSFYSDPSLDDVSFIEGVANDLGVEEILPHAVVSGNTVTPIVKVHNYGFSDATDYTIVLNDGTSDISTVNVTTTLPEDGETYIDMDPWTPADASYTLTATVTLNTPSPDGNAANDVLDQACEVKAFTYNAGQILAYNTFDDEVVDVDHSDGSITSLMATNTGNFLAGGDLVGDEVYGIENGSNDIYIIDGDGSNYKIGTVGGVSESILGIADDITGKGTLYAAVSDGAGGTDLYTIDANWDATLVGSIVADQTIIGLACNSAGDLYGIALGDDNLYSIDKATGAGTVVGPLGIDIAYAQDIGFDRGNDFLYGTLYTTTGKLYTIDVNSGEALEIGTFTDELTMCAVYTSETLVAGSSDTWGHEFGATTSMTNIIIPDGIEIIVSDAKATQACNVLTVEPGGMLTVNGTLNVSNDMIIESDATKNGSLIVNTATGALTVSNNARVQQYLPENTQTYNWHYLSMPITSATADVFPGVDPGTGTVTYAATWDEAADDWTFLGNSFDALGPLVGYAVPLDAATTIEFSGADLITGNQTTAPLSYTAGGTYEGFHLVGLPYTSAYDVSIADAITGTNWTADVWVRNDGNFETHNIAGATGTLTGNVIPAMQGFWVRGDGGPGGTDDMDITFDIANQVHSGANTVYKEWNNEVHLTVSNGELDDELVVYFNDNATGSFEKFDSEKRFAASDLYPQIYTVAEGYKLAINGLAAGKEEYVVPVGFQANNAGTFTFSALHVNEFDASFNVYLVDNETNETIDLRKEDYTFVTTDALNNAGRFELVLTQGTTGIEDVADNFNVFTNNNVLYMNSNVSGNAHVKVTDILGRVAQEELIELNQGMNSFELNTTNGVYVVTVQCNNKVYTEKVVIK